MRHKVLKTKTGYPAPEFSLIDTNGVIKTLKDYSSPFIYLNFCSVESFACQQDFELLKNLHKEHANDFQIVSISIDNDFEKAKEFFKNKGYHWELLSYSNQPDIINEYSVRAYPTYYLINEKGNFSMSPAPSPAENFEYYFFNMMQEKRRQELRRR